MSTYYEIAIYKTASGKEPYIEWEESLDNATLSRIDARFARIRETGNLGVYRSVGDGVFELKFDFGQGYRVYFGYEGKTLLILLLGGHKKTQEQDIRKAKEYWYDYLSEKRGKK
jgi:putative addiction module killer protein